MQVLVPILTMTRGRLTTSLASLPDMAAQCRRSLAGFEVSMSQVIKQVTQRLSYGRVPL